jgi:hypothetical protein
MNVQLTHTPDTSNLLTKGFIMSRHDDRSRRQGGQQDSRHQGRSQQGGYSDYGYERFGQPRNGPSRPYGDYPGQHASEDFGGQQGDFGYDAGQYGSGQSGQRPWSEDRDWERRGTGYSTDSRDWAPPRQGRQQGDAYPRDPGNNWGAHGGQGSDVFGPRGNDAEMGQANQGQFDPDYHQWRNEQLRTLDDDYRNWRQDRYKKFSDEFSNWRKNRPASAGESDSGGTGSKAGHK